MSPYRLFLFRDVSDSLLRKTVPVYSLFLMQRQKSLPFLVYLSLCIFSPFGSLKCECPANRDAWLLFTAVGTATSLLLVYHDLLRTVKYN